MKKGGKRANRKGAGKPRRYNKKRSSNVPDYAGVSCKRTLVPAQGQNFTVNTMYNLLNTQLVDYQRAVQVAQAYQFYRIKKVALTIKPTFDTFSSTTQSKMNLYYMLDKSGAVSTNITLEGLKQMGARPHSLDEKPFVISWSPTVLESAMFAPGAGNNIQSKYQTSPWLTTVSNPIAPGGFAASQIDHLGVYWFIEQIANAGNPSPILIEVEVQFQFKKPLASGITGATEAVSAKVAILDDSPDGIVGGPDQGVTPPL